MLTNVTLVFFLLLIPLAGFIAWAGDRIGHRTGKKRQSLFGLRPRHTAMVFTVGSGMAIALVSFLVFYLGSESFRIVVRDGAELYGTNVRLKQENRTQATALSAATNRAKVARAEAERIEGERQSIERAHDTAVQNLTAAQKRQTEAEKRAKEARSNFEKAAKDLDAARADLTTARTRLTSAQQRLDEKNDRIRRAESRIELAERRVRTADGQVKTAENAAQIAREQATRARQDKIAAERSAEEAKRNVARIAANAEQSLQLQATNLRKQIDDLKQELDRQNRQYAELVGNTEKQRLESVRLTQALQEKRTEYDQLIASTKSLRSRQITYQVGEEVDRIAIRPGQNIWRIQIILDSFLTTAAKKAELRGAVRGKGKFDRAVIVPVRPPSAERTAADLSADSRPQTEEDLVKAAADTIRRANEDVVVVATASTNAVAGEPVSVDLQIRRNPVVLTTDTKVGEITVNGEGSRQEVADALYTFLNRDVHLRLLKAGMIPPTGSVGESAGFTLSGEEWLEIMEQVRRAGPRARVSVFAAKDLRAGDSPDLRFEVKTLSYGVSTNR